LSLPPERCPATMRVSWAAPSKTSGERAQTCLSALACAMPIVWLRMSCNPRAVLAVAINSRCYRITWPGVRRKYDRKPEYGAKQEQHRRDFGETDRIRVKRRLIEISGLWLTQADTKCCGPDITPCFPVISVIPS
jgi:hypothetical protein